MFDFDDEIFNIGSATYYNIHDAAKIVQNVLERNGHKVGIDFFEPRVEVKNAFCDHSKAIKMLKFKDETDLEELITEMYLWAKDIKPKEVKYMNYEIEKNLYSYWK